MSVRFVEKLSLSQIRASPPTTSPGTTSGASCTASAEYHPPSRGPLLFPPRDLPTGRLIKPEGACPGRVHFSRYPPRRVTHSCRLIDRGSLGHVCPLSDGWATSQPFRHETRCEFRELVNSSRAGYRLASSVVDLFHGWYEQDLVRFARQQFDCFVYPVQRQPMGDQPAQVQATGFHEECQLFPGVP